MSSYLINSSGSTTTITYPSNFDLSNFSLLYGIIALALFVVVLIVCTFIVLCYFRVMSRANLRRQQQQRQQQLRIFTLNESNSYMNNEGFQGSDLMMNNDELNTTKPPVYDNILSFSPADKLPTYNSYRQAKDRVIPSAASALDESTNRIEDHPV